MSKQFSQSIVLTEGTSKAPAPVSVVLDGLTSGVTLANASGQTELALPAGSPYRDVSGGFDGGVATLNILFAPKPDDYVVRVLAGPGRR